MDADLADLSYYAEAGATEIDGRSADFEEAMAGCDFPLVVWDLAAGEVRIANQPAANLFGVPLSSLRGRKNVDLFGPRDAVEATFAALQTVAIDDVRSERHLRTVDGRVVAVRVWSRAVEMDGRRAAVCLFVPRTGIGRPARDPVAPWQDLAPIVLGRADRDWRVRALSRDVEDLLGVHPSELLGSSLLGRVHPDDAPTLADTARPKPPSSPSRSRVRFRHASGQWVKACVLVAEQDSPDGGIAFVLLGAPDRSTHSAVSRVAELERRLRHIGAQVGATGLMVDAGYALPSARDFPQLNDLSSRQWEILSRLLVGERVPSIASALFVSQSTVRNHLAAVFNKFGVHSQAELLALLGRRPSVSQCA